MTKLQSRYKKGDKIDGRYLVHQALMGGMGEVYLCLDLENNLPLALKTFQQRFLTNSQQLRQAFENEILTWVALEKHPNIVRCFAMEFIDKQPFMVLEWIASDEGKGSDLRSRLRRGSIDLQLALDFILNICQGLNHAQEKLPGLVHRDLKPENILVGQGGLAKITDFGLAQIIQATELEFEDIDSKMGNQQSHWGQKGIVGTPPYMAPEQWKGDIVDVRTDIYAVGCILYEMLTGHWPFQATSLDGFRYHHMETTAPSIREQKVPVSIGRVVARCLAKGREERWTTIENLIRELSQIYQQEFAREPKTVKVSREFTASDYSNRAVTYRNLHYYNEALADANRAIELDPVYVTAYSARASIYSDLQRYDEALSDCNQAIRLDPTYPIAYFNRGCNYHALQQFDDALVDFNQAIRLDPDFSTAYFNRGALYAEQRYYDKALADYYQAIQLDPNDSEIYNNRGRVYHELQQYDHALVDLNRAIQLDPTSDLPYRNRALTYVALQRDDEALADFNRAIIVDPSDSVAYYNIGALFSKYGDLHGALAYLEKAAKLGLTQAEQYIKQINQVLREDQTSHIDESQQAVSASGKDQHQFAEYFQKITDITPFTAIDFAKRASYHADLQNFEAALADYNRAIKLDPSFATAYYNRGLLYEKFERYKAALADFGQAIKLDPDGAVAYSNRGSVYDNLKQYQQALSEYNRAIELDPNFAPAYYNRGNTFTNLKQHEQALADYNQTIKLDPNFAPAYVNIGVTLGNQGHLQEALHYFEKAAQLGESTGETYAAQTKQRLGLHTSQQTDQSQAVFKLFMQVHSTDEMRQAVSQFPFMINPNSIAAIEQAINEVPLEHRLVFEQRIAWLRQIANEHEIDPQIAEQRVELIDSSSVGERSRNDAKVYWQRGVVNFNLQQYDKALADFNQGLELAPNDANGFNNRGNTYFKLQKYELALTDFNRAIELDPTSAEAYSNRGMLYDALQRHIEALVDLNQAIRLDPTLAIAYSNRGNTYNYLQRPDEALADFNRAIQLDPTLKLAFLSRGVIYTILKRYDEALADLTQAIQLDPNYSKAYYNLGALFYKQNQLFESLSQFEKAAELGLPEARHALTQVKHALKRESKPQASLTQLAFEAFQKAGSVQVMRQAVLRFPIMIQSDFITAVEGTIAQNVPPENQPAFQERLNWLRQIAHEQNQSKQQKGLFGRFFKKRK